MGNVVTSACLNASECSRWTGTRLDFDDADRVLQLQVLHMPVDPSEGAALSWIKMGEKVSLCDLSTGPQIQALSWRYSEQSRNARPSGGERPIMSKEDVELPPWPQQRCFSVHHRFWHVSFPTKPGYFGILQMASNPDQRVPESLNDDTSASAAIAAYAHKFNTQQAAGHAHDPPPAIKVAAPIGCQIVDSGMISMFSVGDAVVLYVLPCVQNVEKFIFNGAEPYADVPQAFFHFVALSSGGKELAYDLQGIQDKDGDVFLVDPALLKVNGKNGPCADDMMPTCGPLLGGFTGGLEWGHFQALHSRCSPLCRAFDPHRAVRLGRGFTCCGN